LFFYHFETKLILSRKYCFLFCAFRGLIFRSAKTLAIVISPSSLFDIIVLPSDATVAAGFGSAKQWLQWRRQDSEVSVPTAWLAPASLPADDPRFHRITSFPGHWEDNVMSNEGWGKCSHRHQKHILPFFQRHCLLPPGLKPKSSLSLSLFLLFSKKWQFIEKNGRFGFSHWLFMFTFCHKGLEIANDCERDYEPQEAL